MTVPDAVPDALRMVLPETEPVNVAPALPMVGVVRAAEISVLLDKLSVPDTVAKVPLVAGSVSVTDPVPLRVMV